ncbi:hypothetical protein AA313_de0206840 [Arthrobotrys entomopaga]|nr:hypothetical protein AA313_de0206840 [Arthrobotrys entomopaga]
MVCEYALFTFPGCQCPALLPIRFCDHHLNPEHPEYEDPATLRNPARITMLFKAPGVVLLHHDYMWLVKVYNDPMYLEDRSLTKQQADCLDWYQQAKVIEKLQAREEVFEDKTTHHTIGFHTKICRYHIIYPKCTDMYIWQTNDPDFFPFLESYCFTHARAIVKDTTGKYTIVPAIVPETFSVPFEAKKIIAERKAEKEMAELKRLDPSTAGPHIPDPSNRVETEIPVDLPKLPDRSGDKERIPSSTDASDLVKPPKRLPASSDPPKAKKDPKERLSRKDTIEGHKGERTETDENVVSDSSSSGTDIDAMESGDEYLPREERMKRAADKAMKEMKKREKQQKKKAEEKKEGGDEESETTTVPPKKKPAKKRKAKDDSDSDYSDATPCESEEEAETTKRPAKATKKGKADEPIIIDEDGGEPADGSLVIGTGVGVAPGIGAVTKKRIDARARLFEKIANAGKKGKPENSTRAKGDKGESVGDPIIVSEDKGKSTGDPIGTGKANKNQPKETTNNGKAPKKKDGDDDIAEMLPNGNGKAGKKLDPKPNNPPGGDSSTKKPALGPDTRAQRKRGSELPKPQQEKGKGKSLENETTSKTDDPWWKSIPRKELASSSSSWRNWEESSEILLPEDPNALRFRDKAKIAIETLSSAMKRAIKEAEEERDESSPSMADQSNSD